MNIITFKDIIKLCEGKIICGDSSLELKNICKDTREIKPGDIYLGIKGENFDGNIFYKDAFDKGAIACILDNQELKIDKYEDKTIIIVPDTISCIQKLAKYKRSFIKVPVIGITGSVGKTSTKELIASVLETKYRVLKTEGSYNNHIGLPLTILRYNDEDVMVIEIGMSNRGEISLLSKIAKPTLSVITNIGTAHIGNLGSRENILKAKLEILDGMIKKKLIVNNDNDLLHEYYLNKPANITTIGIENESDIKGINLNENNTIFDIRRHIKDIPNKYGSVAYIYNTLIGYAVAKELKINDLDFIKGLNNVKTSSKRLEIVPNHKNIIIINDSYNANYDSMKVGLEYLHSIDSPRKIAVLGDMLELGEFSKKMHEDVGKEIVKQKIDYLVTVGNESININRQAIKDGLDALNSFHFTTNKKCIEFLNGFITKNDVLLFKASKNMKFYELINGIL